MSTTEKALGAIRQIGECIYDHGAGKHRGPVSKQQRDQANDGLLLVEIELRRQHGEIEGLRAQVEALKKVVDSLPWYGFGTRPASFPERDTASPAEQQGLFRKFEVRRVDGSDAPGGKHHGCEYFVLDMNHDKAAPAALVAYSDAVATTHPQLSADLRARFGQPLTRPAVPTGWKLVPVEPTAQMIDAALAVDPDHESVWEAYLAAAPQPESAQKGGA